MITEKLPATAYYHPENYIEVESWDGIDKLIQALLPAEHLLPLHSP